MMTSKIIWSGWTSISTGWGNWLFFSDFLAGPIRFMSGTWRPLFGDFEWIFFLSNWRLVQFGLFGLLVVFSDIWRWWGRSGLVGRDGWTSAFCSAGLLRGLFVVFGRWWSFPVTFNLGSLFGLGHDRFQCIAGFLLATWLLAWDLEIQLHAKNGFTKPYWFIFGAVREGNNTVIYFIETSRGSKPEWFLFLKFAILCAKLSENQ